MPTGFVIVCAPRTGSYSLVDRLDSCADIVCHGEIFKKKFIEMRDEFRSVMRIRSVQDRNEHPLDYIQEIKSLSSGKIVGFKLFQAQMDGLPGLAEYVASSATRRIVLFRDPVATYGSLLRAQETGIWTLNAGSTVDLAKLQARVRFTPQTFDRFISSYGAFASYCCDLADLPNTFVIDYSQINDETVIDEALLFLGSSSRAYQTATRRVKQLQVNISDSFENWDELQDYIRTAGVPIRLPNTTCPQQR